MSTYEEEYDKALLSSPWKPLPASSSKPPLILKYAQHPSRPGYIVLLTDFTSVYLEVLTAPSVPSRLNEIARDEKGKGKGKGKGRNTDDSQDGDEDIIARSEKALQRVESLWEDLEGLEVHLEQHDYHDAVLTAHSDDFSWLFHLTGTDRNSELKGRQPLDILSKHIIAPLSSVLLETNNVNHKSKSKPIELVHTLFSSPTITQHMAKHHAPASGAPKRAIPESDPKKSGSAQPNASKSAGAGKRQSPSPVDGEAPMEEEEEEEEEEEAEYQSDASVANGQTSRSTPQSRKQSGGHAQAAKKTSNSDTASDDDNGNNGKANQTKRSATRESSTGSGSENVSVPPPHHPPSHRSKNKHIIASDEEEEEAEGSRQASKKVKGKDRSLSPPILPTPSQTRKEREKAEEDDMHARQEAMKRKMEGGGAGGGNLGRRRLRR